MGMRQRKQREQREKWRNEGNNEGDKATKTKKAKKEKNNNHKWYNIAILAPCCAAQITFPSTKHTKHALIFLCALKWILN
jgi:hypothetical protein